MFAVRQVGKNNIRDILLVSRYCRVEGDMGRARMYSVRTVFGSIVAGNRMSLVPELLMHGHHVVQSHSNCPAHQIVLTGDGR